MAATLAFFSATRLAMRTLKVAVSIEKINKKIEKDPLVFGLLLLLVFEPAALQRVQVTAALEAKRSNKSLDLGATGIQVVNFPDIGQRRSETHALV